MAMNDQKEAFAKAIVRGLSNRLAAIEAGYSEKTASASGSRLAKDEDVLAEIARLKNIGYGDIAGATVTDIVVDEAEYVTSAPSENGDHSESLDRIALSARERAVVRGTTIELDGVIYDQTDPKDQLTLCSLGVISLNRQQIESAKSLLPYHHGKVADQGKKGAEFEAARQAISGRFGTMEPPAKRQGSLWQ